MQIPSISTHKIGKIYSEPHFFVLNKGNNSGKPLVAPCPNCFVLLFSSEEEKEYFYWVTMGLWYSKAFYSELQGSVIPFIRLPNFKRVLVSTVANLSANPVKIASSLSASLSKLDVLERQFMRNLALIKEAKQLVLYKYIRK